MRNQHFCGGIGHFLSRLAQGGQVVAVYELIDDLREQIVRHYAPQIQEYYRRNRVTNGHSTDAEQDGEPF